MLIHIYYCKPLLLEASIIVIKLSTLSLEMLSFVSTIIPFCLLSSPGPKLRRFHAGMHISSYSKWWQLLLLSRSLLWFLPQARISLCICLLLCLMGSSFIWGLAWILPLLVLFLLETADFFLHNLHELVKLAYVSALKGCVKTCLSHRRLMVKNHFITTHAQSTYILASHTIPHGGAEPHSFSFRNIYLQQEL